jgi:hypothetical protein
MRIKGWKSLWDGNLVAADVNPPKNDKIFVKSRRDVTFLMSSLRDLRSTLTILRQIDICRYQIVVLTGLSTLNLDNLFFNSQFRTPQYKC